MDYKLRRIRAVHAKSRHMPTDLMSSLSFIPEDSKETELLTSKQKTDQILSSLEKDKTLQSLSLA